MQIHRKKTIYLFLNLLYLLNCAAHTKSINHSEIKWEGWAGNPNYPNSEPHDYFYLTSRGKVSSKLLETKNNNKIRQVCEAIAITSGKEEFFPSIAYNTIYEQFTPGPREINKLKNALKIKIETKECKPGFMEKSDFDLSNWRECKCILYSKIIGGKELVETIILSDTLGISVETGNR